MVADDGAPGQHSPLQPFFTLVPLHGIKQNIVCDILNSGDVTCLKKEKKTRKHR